MLRHWRSGTVAQVGGRCSRFVNGGALPVGTATRVLAYLGSKHGPFHHVTSRSSAGSRLRAVDGPTSRFSPETAAGFVTGTTLANVSGLAAGRNEILRRKGWDVSESGLYGAHPFMSS